MKPILFAGLLALTACGVTDEAADQVLPVAPVEAAAPSAATDVPAEAPLATTGETAAIQVAAAVATVHSTPDRGTQIQVTETLPPPPTAREVCNVLLADQYRRSWAGLPAAQMCFEAIVVERGWHRETIDAWLPFVMTAEGSILHGESDWCPGRRGGQLVDDFCNITTPNKTPGEDTGWGQATSSLWGRNAILCLNYGYCGWQSILASRYDDMLASVVLVIEELGSRPWCFAEWAIQLHRCRVLPPDRNRY